MCVCCTTVPTQIATNEWDMNMIVHKIFFIIIIFHLVLFKFTCKIDAVFALVSHSPTFHKPFINSFLSPFCSSPTISFSVCHFYGKKGWQFVSFFPFCCRFHSIISCALPLLLLLSPFFSLCSYLFWVIMFRWARHKLSHHVLTKYVNCKCRQSQKMNL